MKVPKGTDRSDVVSRPPSLPLSFSIVSAFAPLDDSQLQLSASRSPPVSPTGDRELFASIAEGHTKFFELLADRGLEFRSSGDAFETEGCIDVAHCFDRNRRTLLHQACRCGNVQVAKCLLFHGANAAAKCREGRTSFHEAAETSETMALQLLKLLFEHEPTGISVVDVNGLHVVHLAAIRGNLEVIQWCSGLITPQTAKHSDSTSPGPQVSRYMVPLGITSFSGRHILHYAAYNGRLKALQWLLSAQNIRCDELALNALDANGYSVMHYAAMGAPLEVCEWLVLESPSRYQLNLTARTSEGETVVQLASARPTSIQHFLTEASRVPSVPSKLRCLGADTTSLGVTWDIEPTSQDTRLHETLKPLYFHLEVCKKPASLSSASGFLTMLMLLPPITPTSPRAPKVASTALVSASSLLKWEPLSVLLQPEAREYWLCGLEKDTEYLVRMCARNRNGFSGYSVPNFSGVFTTSGGSRRHRLSTLQQFFDVFNFDPPKESIANTFIGNLHFELLEARGLPAMCTHQASIEAAGPDIFNKMLTATQGHYYGVLTIETSTTPDAAEFGNVRLLYCVRSPLATLQQDLALSGSSQVCRHPRFSLNSVFRVPEAIASTQVTIAVHYETQGQSNSCCVGRLSLSLLDLVQGMPAKMLWLPLTSTIDPQVDGGLVLLRTLFLPDGISELPHPTLPNTWGSTAEELLATSRCIVSEKAGEIATPPSSSSSTASISPSCSSQFAHPSMLIDRLGFSVFDPEMQLHNGEWHRIQSQSGPARTYAYYQQLVEGLERQQEPHWQQLHCRILAGCSARSSASERSGGVAAKGDASLCCLDAGQRREVRRLVWKGIPAPRRPELYSHMSGACLLQRLYPSDYFLKLTLKLEDPTDEVHSATRYSRFASAKRQIHVDLKRTFAGNEECWLTLPEGQKSLERVLLAYALHNNALGYCQSMTFVVGRLLCLCHAQVSAKSGEIEAVETTTLLFEEEERVFWLIMVICEKLFPSYYTQGMTGLQIDGAVLDKFVRMRLPKLHRHLQQLNAPPIGLVLVTQWLLPLCCAVFPSETTFRLLDVLFFEGSSVVFAMAIALLRISQHDMLAEHVDYTQLFRFLRARDQRLHDAPLLMEVVYEEHQILAAEVDSMRQSFAEELWIDQGRGQVEKKAMCAKLSHPPTDELRPGDTDSKI